MTTNVGSRLSDQRTQVYVLRLYVCGASPRSFEAIKNIKTICERHLAGRFQLEMVDIFQEPERAAADHVVAAPMLVKRFPLPLRRLAGDLSNSGRALESLGLMKAIADVSGRGQDRG
jgi:circadian clock protein KaiB